jgi:5-methylcytosine-specific restriction enzyme subunit McrC
MAHELRLTVSPVPMSVALVHSALAAIDRRTQRYGPALRLIDLLNSGQTAAIFDGDAEQQTTIPGFALDMNLLWQRLLTRVLREWPIGTAVETEVPLRGVFSVDPAFSPRQRFVPLARPDFAVKLDKGRVRLLDAKYRDLWRESLPREMLYQLALYAAAQGEGVVAILYPSIVSNASEERIRIHDVAIGDVRWAVALRPVSLEKLERLIVAPHTDQRDRDRHDFALSLISEAS